MNEQEKIDREFPWGCWCGEQYRTEEAAWGCKKCRQYLMEEDFSKREVIWIPGLPKAQE